LPVRLFTHVQVHFVADDTSRRISTVLEGQVVRRTAHGFAIEWSEFAPEAVFALASPMGKPAEAGVPVYSQKARR
jgi:hypothetical protein